MAGLRSQYLFLYNSCLSGAWAYVVYLMLKGIYEGKGRPEVYELVKYPLQVAQTAAVLEVFHSALGIVRSPLFTTFLQVLSRIWALWGIIFQAPEAVTLGSVKVLKIGDTQLELNLYTLLFAWGTTEILRYGFFAVKEVTTPPYAQLWLRYTAFIPLYPLGVMSELTMAYLAMPIIKARRPLSVALPNKYNFGFDYYCFCWVAILAYLPGLPFLFTYMLQQRQKLLRGTKSKKSEGS